MKASLLAVLAALCCFTWSSTSSQENRPAPGIDSLGWMAGSWHEQRGGTETEEHWIPPKGDLMLGVNRTVNASGKAFFEYLRIAKTAKGISYFASPGGRPATEFPLVQSEEKKIVFENPQHDFPQRISYWLDNDGKLHARIEGVVNGKSRSQEWTWTREKRSP